MLSQVAVMYQLVVAKVLDHRTDERGASLIEYVLLLAMIVAVAIGAMVLLGDTTANSLSNSAQNIGGSH